jgi:hypothetical protein
VAGLAVAGAAAAGGSLLGDEVWPEAAEPPEQPAKAKSGVVNTAMKSRFMILPESSGRASIRPDPAYQRR